MSATNEVDVLVIGAGPVGLTLAGELQRYGVRVRIVERKTGPNEEPNAAIVHVRTLEILCAMGAVEGFLREGFALPGLQSWVLGKRIGFIDLKGLESPFGQPRTIGQQHTERLLAEHFEKLGGSVERGVEAMRVEQDERTARVQLRHLTEGNREEEVTAAWVVGCEGSKSISREAAGLTFEGKRYEGKEFLQMEANVRWSHAHGFAYQFFTPEQAVLLFPYEEEGFYRIICARKDQNPENHTPPTVEEIQAILRSAADPQAEVDQPRWKNRFRTGYRLAQRFRTGRIFLAGDAGHVHVPIGGQGMNYGIHDAFNLSWKLAAVIQGQAGPKLLETYSAERHPVDEALVKGTDRAFHLLIEHPWTAARAMGLLGPLALGLPVLQQRIRDTLGEMKVAYTSSALTEDHGGSSGSAAGARAPDAIIVRLPECKTAHLFDLLRGTHWTLLLFAGLNPSASDLEMLEELSGQIDSSHRALIDLYLVLTQDPSGALPEKSAARLIMDREHYAHAAYGAEGAPCLYLIRPDWYIGYRGGLESGADLTRYLKRHLTS